MIFCSKSESKAVVLKQGVATHLCVVGFLWCVAKNFGDIILRKDHANLSFKHKYHDVILSQKCVAKNNFMKNMPPTKKG